MFMSLGRIRKNKQTCFLFINIDYMDWLFSFSFFILSNAYIILDLFHHVYYSRKNASIIWQGLATVANFCTYRSLLYCVGRQVLTWLMIDTGMDLSLSFSITQHITLVNAQKYQQSFFVGGFPVILGASPETTVTTSLTTVIVAECSWLVNQVSLDWFNESDKRHGLWVWVAN